MKEKKLLAILSRYLWPVDSGRKESLNHYFKELHENYGYEIKVLCFLEKGQKIDKNEIPNYIEEVIELEDVSNLTKITNILTKSFGFKKWPFQCSIYYSNKNKVIIRDIIKKWKPNVIFTEMIRTCSYYDVFKDSGSVLIANLDDLLSVRYERQLKNLNSKASFAGNYDEKISKKVSKIINLKFIKKVILKKESRRCYIWEKKYYKLYDYILMTSEIETKKINSIMKNSKAKTLSVGIDYSYYSEQIRVEKDMLGIAFHGNMKTAANSDSLDYIINEVLSRVNMPWHLYVIGKCPENLVNKYSSNKNIVFCGRVDDLRPYIKKAYIYLSPLLYGTGIKTKIVEALAMNMCVVTNSVGIEGIPGQNGKDYLVVEDPVEIAKTIEELFLDANKVKNIGQNAGEFALNHYSWPKVFKVFKEMNL